MPDSKPTLFEIIPWVVANYHAVVSKNEKTGGITYDYEKADPAPPSGEYRTYMVQAATSPVAFFGQLAPRYMGDGSGDDISEEDLERERKTIQQIRKILRQFREAEG